MISWSMESNALVRSIKTTLFRRPLSMFTDQAFVASSKAVSVLCRERKPDWQLSSNLLASRSRSRIVYNSFKNFRNNRDYRYWPIVVRIRFTSLFKKWSHFGRFPVVWIYPRENRLWEDWGKRGCDGTRSHFQQFTRNHIKAGGFRFINFRIVAPR